MWQWQNLTQTNEKNPPCKVMEMALAIASVMVTLSRMIVPSPSSCYCCSTCAPSSSSSHYYVVVTTQDATMVEPNTHKQKKIDSPEAMEVVVAIIGTMGVLLHATSSPSPSSSSCYHIVVVTQNATMAKPHTNKQKKCAPPTMEVIVGATSSMAMQ
jgi:hypothetical protein